MSRSIGDAVAHSVGASSEPEFCNRRLVGEDKFILIASDGLWEYLDSIEAIDIMSNFYQSGKLDQGVDALMHEARRRWTTTVQAVDDMTLVLITFKT
jgi:serine/threonine protein phosphatase PrpC